MVSTLTLTVGTDGGRVEVTVGVKMEVEVKMTTEVGEVGPTCCVRAKDVRVASTSSVGVGVTVGKLHANAAEIKALNKKSKPLFFFTTGSFTTRSNRLYL